MIIFFNRKTGKIEGTIAGRVHDKQHLNMWIGDKAETDRIVIQWEPVRWLNKDRQDVPKDSPDIHYTIYDVNFPQKDILPVVEKEFSKLHARFRIDPETKRFVHV